MHRHRDNLIIEGVLTLRRDCPLVAGQGKLVLLFPANLVAVIDVFSGHPHWVAAPSVIQAVTLEGVDQLAVTETVTLPCPLQEVGRVGHTFHPPGNNYLGLARLNQTSTQVDTGHPRSAHIVDRDGRN